MAKTTAPAGPRPFRVRLSDPLTEVTRKERRSLLGVATAALVLVHAGVVPTRISALGIEFTTSNQQALLRVAAFVIGYFLVTFVIYGVNDYLAWHHELQTAIREQELEEREEGLTTRSRSDARPRFGPSLVVA